MLSLGEAGFGLSQARKKLQPPLTRLIQNGFIGEAKAGEARKTGFFQFLVYFNPGLQNGFTLQYINLRKIDEAEADVSRAKEALRIGGFDSSPKTASASLFFWFKKSFSCVLVCYRSFK